MKDDSPPILIRSCSHRAQKRLITILGYEPALLCSLYFDGYFCYVSPNEWEKLKEIKGIKKAHVDQTKLQRTIKFFGTIHICFGCGEVLEGDEIDTGLCDLCVEEMEEEEEEDG